MRGPSDFDGTPHTPSGPFTNPEPDPRKSWPFGTIVFLASLTMLFGASLFGYLYTRTMSPEAPPPGAIQLPEALWASTAVLLLGGGAMHAAARAARSGQRRRAVAWMRASAFLTVGFLMVQVPALWQLMDSHREALLQGTGLWGLCAAMIGLHAAHVLGGLAPLGVLLGRERAGTLRWPGAEAAIHSCALYWHFLEAVWLVMFIVFWIMG